MPKGFFAYSHLDRQFVVRLAGDLKGHGIDVWLDVEQIPAGEDWSNEVNKALQTCDYMLLVISPESMASDQVDKEWKYFLTKKKLIIPIILRPVENLHYLLINLQYVDFHLLDYSEAEALLIAEISRRTQNNASKDVSNEGATTQKLTLLDTNQLPSVLTKRTGRLNPEALREHEEKSYSIDGETILRFVSSGASSNVITISLLPERENVIGRPDSTYTPEIDLTNLGAENSGVSRRHARLVIEDRRLFISDLGSLNGTSVNGVKLYEGCA